MSVAKYVVKRIVLAIVTVFIICAITFFAMNAIPGGPFEGEKALSPEVKAVLLERYNLDKPVGEQFVLYLRNLLRGDFGVSLKTGRDIATTVLESFSISAKLGGMAALVALILGLILGSTAALLRNRWPDRVIVFSPRWQRRCPALCWLHFYCWFSVFSLAGFRYGAPLSPIMCCR